MNIDIWFRQDSIWHSNGFMEDKKIDSRIEKELENIKIDKKISNSFSRKFHKDDNK